MLCLGDPWKKLFFYFLSKNWGPPPPPFWPPQFFLIKIFWLGPDPPPFLTESKKNSSFMPPLSPKIERRRLPAAPEQVVWKGRGWRGSKLKCKAPLILRLLPIHAICIAKPALHSLHLTHCKCYICFNSLYATSNTFTSSTSCSTTLHPLQNYIYYKTTSAPWSLQPDVMM